MPGDYRDFLQFSEMNDPWRTTDEQRDLSRTNILFMVERNNNMSDKFTLVRAPLITDPDGSTNGEYEKCSYAFFPGCCLCANEPEIAAKVYDSLLFQNPDTAIFMECCENADEIREKWSALGKPEMILCCTECEEFFAGSLADIPTVSLYDKFLEYEISGGCNSVDYCLHESVKGSDSPDFAGCSVAALAKDMGADLHKYEEGSPFPYLVCDISVRNDLKESGHDAAHILELMFGMGSSNTHLIHEHDHDDGVGSNSDGDESQTGGASPDDSECDGNCAACAGCSDKPHPPQALPTDAQKASNRLELKDVLLALYWNEL